jgi:hypothetical protein
MKTVMEFLDSIAGKLQSAFEKAPTAWSIPVELTEEEIEPLTFLGKELDKDFQARFNALRSFLTVKFDDLHDNVIQFEIHGSWDLLKDNQNPVAQKLWNIFKKAKSNATTAALESLWPTIKSALPTKFPYLLLLIELESNQSSQAKLIADYLNSEGQGVFEAEIRYPDGTARHYGVESITLGIRKVQQRTETFQDNKLNELLTIFKNQEEKAEGELKQLWSTIISIVKSQVYQGPERSVKLTKNQSNIAKLEAIKDFLNREGQDVFKAKLVFPDENAQHYGQDSCIGLSIEKVGEPTKPVQGKLEELFAIFNSNEIRETKPQQLEEGNFAIGPTSASSSSSTNIISQNTPKNEEVLQLGLPESDSDALNQETGSDSNRVKGIEECLKMQSSPAVYEKLARGANGGINESITLLQVFLQNTKKPDHKHDKCYKQMTSAIKDQIATAETLRNYIKEARAYPGVVAEDIESLEKLMWDSINDIFATDKDLQSKIERIEQRHKEANDIVKRLEKHDPNHELKNFGKCVAVFMCGLIGILVLTTLACGLTLACPPLAAVVFGIIAVAGITKASLLGTAAAFLLGFLPGAGIGTSIFFFSKSAPSRFLEFTQKVLEKQEQLPKPTRTEPESGIYDQPKKRK